jgi:Asp-tRNA(Asn)/Glu-tRNA(Gln) amidotransferase A subunit family amidase
MIQTPATTRGVEDCLTRVRERNAAVKAWAYLDVDGVREQSRITSQESDPGLLSGVVLGVKDIIDVAGMPTSHGSPIFANNIAGKDAESVRLLRGAGASVLGKTVTAEFAVYSPGPTANPRALDHTPGGSSSGSAAAVADGQAHLALGTQTAGSMLRPASYCGCLGFKPSFRRYPLAGVLETAPSLDTLGLFASNIEILACADAVLSGQPQTAGSDEKPMIALCRTSSWAKAEPVMQDAYNSFTASLAEAGFETIVLDLPPVFEKLQEAQKLMHCYEASKVLGPIARDHPDQVSNVFADFIDQGSRYSEADYRAALATQQMCKELFGDLFGDAKMLLVPGALGPAPKGLGATGDPEFQRLWTALGVPCLGFPADWTDKGLPLGVQLIGRFGSDSELIARSRPILNYAQFKDI